MCLLLKKFQNENNDAYRKWNKKTKYKWHLIKIRHWSSEPELFYAKR